MVALICKPILRHTLPPTCKSLFNNPVTCPDEEALAAAAGGPSGVPPSQAEGPPPLLLARQAARGLQAPDSHQDRVHSGEHTSTSVGVFELIDKSVSYADISRRHNNIHAKLHLPAVQFGAVPLLQAHILSVGMLLYCVHNIKTCSVKGNYQVTKCNLGSKVSHLGLL